MIRVQTATEFGDAFIVLTMPDGRLFVPTSGGVEEMDQLAAELRDWCEAWRSEPHLCVDCEGTGDVTCGLCSGTGCSPSSFGSDREYRCSRCGGNGVVKCERCEA